MNFWLQEYRFDQSKYERPSLKWVCGWAKEGKACPLGPDEKGRCVTTYECFPLKKGDRWFCARSKSYGGVCKAGPLPDGTCCNSISRCQPALSMRAKRGAVARWGLVFVVGVILLFLSGSSRPNFISPGELGSQHQTVSNSCGNCHSVFDGGPVEWVRAAFSSNVAADDRELCLSCHNLGKDNSSPHGISREKISKVTARIEKRGGDSTLSLSGKLSGALFGRGGASLSDSIPCAACHQEHRGKDADLTAMSALQCQSCHASRFTSFSKGHPDFSTFPFQQRTKLIFDHSSHLNKHFMGKAKERAPRTCRSCHTVNASGADMTVQPFEKTCAACHEGQIMGKSSSGVKGIPFLELPGLDTESLKKAKIDVGHWPQDAEAEEIIPFMQLLLSADPNYKKVAAILKDVDLLDLSGADAEKKSAAGQLAWAVKKLVFDLAANGQRALRARLEKVVSKPLSDAEFSRLSGQLPVGIVRSAQRAWFPGLDEEMARRESGKKAGSGKKRAGKKKDGEEEEKSEDLPSAEEVSVAGGWYVQDFSLFYRPSGHGDRFQRGWLELTGRSGPVMREVFSVLSGPKATGYCGKCHSIDETGEGALRINWKAKRSDERLKTFNRFKHEPHFSLLDEKGCMTCHKMNPEAKYLDGFKDFDRSKFTSNFSPISKTVCASCHTRNSVSENCLTCHNYHIGKVSPALTSAPIRIQKASK